jgi:lipopolysaccharide export system permease protein
VIIERYLLKDIIYTLAAVTLVLTVIYLGNRFIIYLTNAAVGGASPRLILTLLVLKSAGAMVVVIPMALFLAILFVFGRLYKDSEMTALTACGVSMGRIVRIVLFFSLAVAAGVAFISLYLKPWAEEQSYKIQDRIEADSEITGIAAGRFNESAQGDGVLYAEELAPGTKNMRNVFIQYQRNGQRVVLSADRAYQKVDAATGDHYIVLVDGHRYEGTPGTARFRIIQFKEHALLLRPRQVVPSQRKRWALPTGQLWYSADPGDAAELQWRLSMPVSTLVLAMLAITLSRTTPRQGRFAKLFNAILAYVIYSNLLAVAQTWLEHGAIPPWLGLWWVHGVFILVVLVSFARQYGIGLLSRVIPARVPAA